MRTFTRRLRRPKLADVHPPDTFASVTTWVAVTVLQVTKAAHPAMSLTPGTPEAQRWHEIVAPTAKEALAFALHAVERGAMELGGPEGRSIVIESVWPSAIRLTAGLFEELGDEGGLASEVEAISAQYRRLEPFNPSVLEAAFLRTVATCYEGTNDQHLEGILKVMKNAVGGGALQDALSISWLLKDVP